MKGKAVAATILISIGIAVLAVFPLGRAKVPEEIQQLRIGQNVDAIQKTAPWLNWDTKDHNRTCLSGATTQRRLGIDYRWVFSVDLDQSGKVIRIDGRSSNDISGVLDLVFNKP